MAAKRYTMTVKASGMQSSAQQRQLSTFVYFDEGKATADVVTACQAIAGLMNGTLVSITEQIWNDPTQTFGAATANGGSDRASVSFRSGLRRLETITLPIVKHNVSGQAIEAVFEDPTFDFRNRENEPLGQYVAAKRSQVIDGA